MTNQRIGGALLLALLAVSIFAGCSTRRSTGDLFYGESTPLGNGTAHTWVHLDEGRPIAVGVRLSEDALNGLPQQTHHGDVEYVLDLPEQARDLPFTHVALNWNPQGHAPEMIYTVPHFDIHFYTISQQEREAITPDDPAYQVKMDKEPEGAFLPAGYMNTREAIPRMGTHWVAPTSPELNGQPFTHTMIFGSYDGRLVFFEPMITRDFLARKVNARQPIAWPERFEKPGYYPSAYAIEWDAENREHIVRLDEFRVSR